MFIILLLDSMFSYFSTVFSIPNFPTNALLLPLLIVAIFLFGSNTFRLNTNHIFGITLVITGFLLGIAFIQDVSLRRLGTLATGIAAFFIGNALGKFPDSDRHIANIGLLIGGLYCIVCTIATLKILPTYFPVTEALGFSDKGTPIIRPEVTIDQNFQIFYLFPVVLCFTQRQSLTELSISLLLTSMAIFSLLQLQTRSGVLLILLAISAAFILSVAAKKKHFILLIVGAIVIFLLGMWKIDALINISSGLIIRLTEDDFGGVEGRLFSATYLFQNIFNISWWLPQGNELFVSLYGDVPHFNPTAIFLEAGTLGLIGWFLIVLAPVIKNGFYIFRARMRNNYAIYIGALTSLGASLTLNTPLYEHAWVWAGLLVGATYKNNLRHQSNTYRHELNTRIA